MLAIAVCQRPAGLSGAGQRRRSAQRGARSTPNSWQNPISRPSLTEVSRLS